MITLIFLLYFLLYPHFELSFREHRRKMTFYFRTLFNNIMAVFSTIQYNCIPPTRYFLVFFILFLRIQKVIWANFVLRNIFLRFLFNFQNFHLFCFLLIYLAYFIFGTNSIWPIELQVFPLTFHSWNFLKKCNFSFQNCLENINYLN